jgi:hypothetical protein
MPVANSKSAPPTRPTSDSRSSRCAGLRRGGHANSRGATDQSLASSRGTVTMPTVTCTPWLTAYSHHGDAGQPKPNGCTPPAGRIALRPSAGW